MKNKNISIFSLNKILLLLSCPILYTVCRLYATIFHDLNKLWMWFYGVQQSLISHVKGSIYQISGAQIGITAESRPVLKVEQIWSSNELRLTFFICAQMAPLTMNLQYRDIENVKTVKTFFANYVKGCVKNLTSKSYADSILVRKIGCICTGGHFDCGEWPDGSLGKA